MIMSIKRWYRHLRKRCVDCKTPVTRGVYRCDPCLLTFVGDDAEDGSADEILVDTPVYLDDRILFPEQL